MALFYNNNNATSSSIVGQYDNKVTFSSMVQVRSALNEVSRIAQDATLKEMKEELNKRIMDAVYNDSSASQWKSRNKKYAEEHGGRTYNTRWNTTRSINTLERYIRTYDMLKVFVVQKSYNSHGRVYGSIKMDGNKLSHNRAEFQHTSPFKYKKKNHDLSVQGYVDIINNGLSKDHSMFGEIKPRPFWEDFVQWSNVNYKRIYERHFREQIRKLQSSGQLKSR